MTTGACFSTKYIQQLQRNLQYAYFNSGHTLNSYLERVSDALSEQLPDLSEKEVQRYLTAIMVGSEEIVKTVSLEFLVAFAKGILDVSLTHCLSCNIGKTNAITMYRRFFIPMRTFANVVEMCKHVSVYEKKKISPQARKNLVDLKERLTSDTSLPQEVTFLTADTVRELCLHHAQLGINAFYLKYRKLIRV